MQSLLDVVRDEEEVDDDVDTQDVTASDPLAIRPSPPIFREIFKFFENRSNADEARGAVDTLIECTMFTAESLKLQSKICFFF